MGLYKEVNHYLIGLAERQRQIYPDAADSGIPVTGPKDKLCTEVAASLKDDFLFGGLKQHRTEYKTKRMIQVSIIVYLPWEEVGNSLSCTKWVISYISDVGRKVHFLSFESYAATVPSHKVFNGD